jgi:hypothetical protein
MERFTVISLASCFDDLNLHRPANLNQLVTQLVGRDLIKDGKGLRMTGEVRQSFDELYGMREETVIVDKLLADLPGKLSNPGQKDYLDEALGCFRCKRYRAAMVMAWNVVYDHLIAVVTASHLSAFNARHPTIFTGKQAKDAVTNRDDFQKWKESEVIQICYAANLIGKEVNKVLVDSLNKRNSAAHPSGSQFNKLQAEAYISDLINNAMLKVT